MSNMYSIGDVVESLVDAQGLTNGARYLVADVFTSRNFLGAFTVYDLLPIPVPNPPELLHDIGNGHLVLKLIAKCALTDGEARELIANTLRGSSDPCSCNECNECFQRQRRIERMGQ